MKGKQLILLLLLLVIIGGVGSYLYLNREQKNYLPAAFALPESAVFVYQGQRLSTEYDSLKKQGWYKFLKQSPSVTSFEADFRYFDSLLSESKGIKKSIAANPLVISLHVVSADDYQLLILHQTQDNFNTNDIENLAKGQDANARVLEHTFENIKIRDIKNGNKQSLFSYAFMDGIIALSRNPVLIEDAVHAYKSNKSKSSPLVQRMVDTRNEDKVFINFTKLPDLLNLYLSPEFHSNTQALSYLAMYGVYGWEAGNSNTNFNGNISTNGDKSYLWNCLLNQKPKPVGMPKVLPVSTALFYSYGADSFAGYYSQYKTCIKSRGQADALEQKKIQAETSTGISIDNDIAPLIGQEWGYAMLEPAAEGTEPEELLIIKAADTTTAYSKLKMINSKATSRNQATYEAVFFRGHKIEKLPCDNEFQLLLGDGYKNFVSPFFTKIGDYIVFSQNATSIQKCIEAYLDNQSLARAPYYKQFAQSMSNESNFCLFINPSRSMTEGAAFVKGAFKNQYETNYSLYKGFNAFSFQIASTTKEFKSQINLARASEKQSSSEMVWSTTLEADLLGKPHIVNNAEGRQKEIMVQDKSYNLYLISVSGNVIWKKKLDEPIEGDIYTIDLYKNAQTGYIFATTSKLYLLNGQGENAGNYPLNLAEPTHTGIGLFDLNKNKEYVYFVSSTGNKIYAYNASGKPLAGWSGISLDAPLTSAVQDFNAGGKNYFFGSSTKGTLYIWNENAKPAIKPISLHTHLKNSFKISVPAKSLISVDTSGVLYNISFDGKVQKRSFPRFRNDPFFDYYDTDGDSKYEYILAGDKLIASYNKDSTEAWKLITSDKLTFAPEMVTLNGKTYIGYVSVSTSKVYLFTRAGTPFGNFPRIGNTPFAIDDLNGNQGKEMVIGGPNKMLYLYRLSE